MLHAMLPSGISCLTCDQYSSTLLKIDKRVRMGKKEAVIARNKNLFIVNYD